MAYKMEKEIDTKFAYYQNNKISFKAEIKTQSQAEEKKEINNCEENEDSNNASEKDYVNVVKKIKKENITPDNIGEIMLCQIPGISSITALAVMNKFKSISNLIKEVETNMECLKDLSYTNSKGQIRKINKSCILNIVKFLLKK
jgi:ERCC4-type nuclease